MSRILTFAACLAAVAAVIAAPASANATQTLPTYRVSGVETGVPQGETSPFAGVAFSLTAGGAVWSASVDHTALSGCTETSESCTITGGSFQLLSLHGAITGTFIEGGTITPERNILPDSCLNEKYDVAGSLTTNLGPAEFDVVLTHYQVRLFGRCVTYFATVSGTFGP
jgi:hypothetical protein